MSFIGWIIVGLIAGWLAEKLMKRDHGLLTNLIVGVLGAFIGGLITSIIGIGDHNDFGWILSIVTATLGAVILLWILGIVESKTGTRK
ncbi:membrane protein [Corynebacterium phocae]|uniref:Membrane protein n=1 Tax=Corynebacterium phocae TaxID=161895 RepID=A0A1L7D633_9CORY|nr:GlsB/YeaQ/YmgE family stress response membrane protein [Corynebacterium phocae]APT93453.1 membrane protein [Corynebacterium phocae]KAA8721147.1 GlsB/YeaQ/YmgE family stress response membrane protein [Corynebacterium phocae]